jgi:DNA-binding NarL/FixJ family response regulator
MNDSAGGLPQANQGASKGAPTFPVPRDSTRSGAARADRKARILVVEDHAFVREGIVRLLNGQPDLICCGETDSIAASRLAVAERQPDLILLDLNLKDGLALEMVGWLRLEFPDSRILVLSQLDEAQYAPKALQAGAKGYIMKETATADLLDAIRIVLSGRTYLSAAMASKYDKLPPTPTEKACGSSHRINS